MAEDGNRLQSVTIAALQIEHWPQLPFGPARKSFGSLEGSLSIPLLYDAASRLLLHFKLMSAHERVKASVVVRGKKEKSFL